MTILEAIQRGLILFVFVFLVLAVLFVLILLFSQVLKRVNKGKPKVAQVAAISSEQFPVGSASTKDDGLWGGSLQLKNVDEQTAAMIMAIVSNESGIPLSELIFKKISLVEEKPKTGEDEK